MHTRLPSVALKHGPFVLADNHLHSAQHEDPWSTPHHTIPYHDYQHPRPVFRGWNQGDELTADSHSPHWKFARELIRLLGKVLEADQACNVA